MKVDLQDGLYQVCLPRLCGGFVVKNGRIIACAPILLKRIKYWVTVAVPVSYERGDGSAVIVRKRQFPYKSSPRRIADNIKTGRRGEGRAGKQAAKC